MVTKIDEVVVGRWDLSFVHLGADARGRRPARLHLEMYAKTHLEADAVSASPR
jgi:hypothetical protein